MTYLISEKTVKSLTNISDDLHSGFLCSAIRESQVIDAQQVLGSKLLNKVCELVEEGKITDPENKHYKELLDGPLTYFLAYTVVQRLCVITSVKVSNAGLNITRVENDEPLSMRDVFTVEDYYRHKADHYKMLLQNWLINRVCYLPELDAHQLGDIRSNLYSAASCGLFLGGKRGKGFRFHRDEQLWC